jgi:hypothetical protein
MAISNTNWVKGGLVYLGSYLYFIFIFSTIGQGIMQTIWGKVEELSKVMR